MKYLLALFAAGALFAQTPALAVDSGATVPYTDTAGHVWLPDQYGLQIENLVTPFDNDLGANDPNNLWLQGFARGVADITLWRTGVHGLGGTNGSGDIYFEPIIAPNGTYDVRLYFGVTSQNQGPTACWGSYSSSTQAIGAMNLITNGVIQAHGWDPGIPGHNMCRTPTFVDIPANVTNRVLSITVATNSTSYNEPFLNAYSITPYTGTATWAIDAQQTTQVLPGGSVQMYVQDWGTGFSDPTWKVSSGPGSVSSTGIYTAPNSQAITAKANISACSSSHPTICGSTQLIVVGAGFNGLAQ